MSIRVNFDRNLIQTRLNDLVDKGQYALANQVYADTQRFVPFLSGDLRNQSNLSFDFKSISWNTPYARRQYYNVGANFSEPGTGAKWDELAKQAYIQSWIDVTRRAMR